IKGQLAPRMPVGRELTAAEIASVEDWVRALAPAQHAAATGEWRWPYERPVKHEPPPVADRSWIRNPIDGFILSRLERAGLRPAPPAAKQALARRVYLDLIGMPPSPAELQSFLADESSDPYEKLIDRLL